MAPLLFLSIQNRSGRKCSRMANSSALPFPIPSKSEGLELRKGPKTWCFRTKEQGIAGDGAPRPCRQRPIRTWGRGASGRRNKGLRGVKHHVHAGIGPSGPGDVVSPDEGIRDCGERSTTSHRRRRIGLQRLGAKETKKQDNMK